MSNEHSGLSRTCCVKDAARGGGRRPRSLEMRIELPRSLSVLRNFCDRIESDLRSFFHMRCRWQFWIGVPALCRPPLPQDQELARGRYADRGMQPIDGADPRCRPCVRASRNRPCGSTLQGPQLISTDGFNDIAFVASAGTVYNGIGFRGCANSKRTSGSTFHESGQESRQAHGM